MSDSPSNTELDERLKKPYPITIDPGVTATGLMTDPDLDYVHPEIKNVGAEVVSGRRTARLLHPVMLTPKEHVTKEILRRGLRSADIWELVVIAIANPTECAGLKILCLGTTYRLSPKGEVMLPLIDFRPAGLRLSFMPWSFSDDYWYLAIERGS